MTKKCIAVISILLLCAVIGCGKKDKEAQKQVEIAPGAILPHWAPENPSPEFLRAAKVLKPTLIHGDEIESTLDRALVEKFNIVSVPAWEFFGTLSDEEVKRLFSGNVTEVGEHPASVSKAMRLEYKTMTRGQQAAFHHYLDVWRNTYEGLGDSSTYEGGLVEDKLVVLYKRGAREDLSNLLFEFQVLKNHLVRVFVYVVQEDGSLSRPVNVVFGYS